MKILYHHRTRATDAQGIHIWEMVEAFRKEGHQVRLVSLLNENGPRTSVPTSSAIRSAPAHKTGSKFRIPFINELCQLGYNLAGLPMLLWAMRGGAVDFLYERHALFNFSGVLAAKIASRPIVIEVNSPLGMELHRDGVISSLAFAKWTESLVLRMATMVVVVSTPLARIVEAMGVAEDKIKVLPNGADIKRFKLSSHQTDLRRLLGLEDKIVIGFAGWFKRWHGLEMLLQAFYDLRLSGAGARLVLVGDGPAMPELQNFVDSHDMHEAVIFSGPVSRELMPDYISMFDLAVQPAANEYCCPMKLLEYMSLAKAVVAPRQENILDILSEDEAFLFQAGDPADLGRALESLVLDAELRRSMGTKAQQALMSRRLTWTENARSVVAFSEGFKTMWRAGTTRIKDTRAAPRA